MELSSPLVTSSASVLQVDNLLGLRVRLSDIDLVDLSLLCLTGGPNLDSRLVEIRTRLGVPFSFFGGVSDSIAIKLRLLVIQDLPE